jgi:hypothetical protein
VLINSKRQGLMPLVTPLLHPLCRETRLGVSQLHSRQL